MVNILDGYNVAISYPPPFTGATANTRGDVNGALDPMDIFIVRGEVKAIVYGVCTTSLEGATAVISLGVQGNTSLFIAGTTSTDLVAGDVWFDTTPTEVKGITETNISSNVVRYLTNSSNIVENYATADTTAGNIYYVCLWLPISKDGKVEAVFK